MMKILVWKGFNYSKFVYACCVHADTSLIWRRNLMQSCQFTSLRETK